VTAREVAPRIFAIESRLGNRRLTQWLVVGDDGVLLSDTGVSGTVGAHIVPALDALGIGSDRLAQVAISHADVDHYGGDAEVRALAPGAAIRAHALDRPLIESWERIAHERYGWYRDYGFDYDEATWRWLEQSAGPDTSLDGELTDGERIDLGRVGVEVLHLPGHSPGHTGLYEPVTRTAVIGDAAMGSGFERLDGSRAGPPPYVDLPAYRATIARLLELAPARLATTHNPVLEGEAVTAFLELSRRFTDDVERAIERAQAAGAADPRSLLPPVAAALGGYPETEHELARSIGAHLAAPPDGRREVSR
jgi:glyoxylase-like metal-dependent hydrolase (beta-lactamase superfamily II)